MKKSLALAALLSASPSLAFAHTGADHVHSLAAGLSHPVTGADHLLAMVAVGVLAAGFRGAGLIALPAAFVGAMALGGIAAAAGAVMPSFEIGIALSLVALGLAVALRPRLALAPALAAVALFGAFHGAAHGAEMPADAAGLAYGLGFLGATALLHAAGAFAGLKLAAGNAAVRLAGAGTAVLGLSALAGF